MKHLFEAKHPDHADEQVIEAAAHLLKTESSTLADWLNTYASTHKQRLAFDLGYLKSSVAEGGHILEIGSVPLLLTTAIKQQGYQIEGVDIDPSRFASSIENIGLTIHQCDIERQPLPFEDNAFDCIIFNEIFEHLRTDLITLFEDLRRILKPGGRLILTTPNVRSVEGVFSFLVRGRSISCGGGIFDEYNKIRQLGHMGHVREYTCKEVTEFLRKMGFEIVSVTHRGRYLGIRGTIAGLFPRMNPFMQFIAKKKES